MSRIVAVDVRSAVLGVVVMTADSTACVITWCFVHNMKEEGKEEEEEELRILLPFFHRTNMSGQSAVVSSHLLLSTMLRLQIFCGYVENVHI